VPDPDLVRIALRKASRSPTDQVPPALPPTSPAP
jgi:hypothetical protein